jgi:FdhD protein
MPAPAPRAHALKVFAEPAPRGPVKAFLLAVKEELCARRRLRGAHGLNQKLKRYQEPFDQDIPGVMPWHIQRLTQKGRRAVEGGVVVEEPLEVRLDGKTVAVLMRTPGMEKELAAGFSLGEGLIEDLADIALVRHCGRVAADVPAAEAPEADALDESRNRVDIRLMPGAATSADPRQVIALIRSGCGRTDVGTLIEDLTPVNGRVKIQTEVLAHLPAQMTREQSAYKAAGGIHAAAIFDASGRVIVVCEDIGRHNAVDKATGYCLLRGISLTDKILVSTGRASYDMVVKGVRLGIPVLASISSPTSMAVELADALGCTLLGYLRGRTLNVYTHGWRIENGTRNPKEGRGE